jgi:primosomal protein N' (replication factor Y) (superfamily II helicase)
MPTYCEVALTVPLRTSFTYELPESLVGVIEPGSRVAVPFRKKVMVGVVLQLTDKPPDFSHEKSALVKIKKISRALDAVPALPRTLIDLGNWLGSYYLATPGDVFRAMLPPLTELRAEKILRITPAGIDHLAELKALQNRSEDEITEHALLELIEVEGAPLAVRWLKKLPGGEDAAARLLRHGHLKAEEIHKSRATRTQKIIAWNLAHVEKPKDSPALGGKTAKPKKISRSAAEAEERVRLVLAEESGPLPLKLLIQRATASRAVIERMLRDGKLTSWDEAAVAEEDDFFDAGYTAPANVLNADQEYAVSELRSWLDRGEFTVGLLHGVTGSGKTEVYLRAVAEALRLGKTAIVLVPEIALTLWMGRIFRAWFGDEVAVLHSALPDAERSREWWRVRRGEAKIVVGTRSAVFAPVANLGLVIVDEEHEASYKQEESPRYHGRDTAVMRAKLENAAALLGSATPSLESYHHAREGKYTLLRLESRVANREMARVEVVDMRQDFKKTHRASAISSRLREAVAERLVTGAQSLILINRRGYSFLAMCRSCGASVQCENCSISLTYHKKRQRMVCHYCGFSIPVVKKCPKCNSEFVYFVGEGAERLEESLRELFPDARIGRLDRDTVRTKREYQKILGAFASSKLDVLVGTQMVAKGHDFQRVTLVGVVSADLRLGMPDFRAAERTFQLLTQVAGRAGRGEMPGEVFVESFYPEHYAIQDAARQDFEGFFDREVRFRRAMHYPPFAALANVLVRDRKVENAIRWARQLGEYFAPFEKRGVRVLGPAVAPLARLKEEHRFQFLLKSPSRASLHEALAGCLDFCAKKQIPDTAIVLDVDPLSLF